MIKVYETERLILKPTSEEDAAFIFELLNTPKWLKYIGDRNIRSVDNARDFIKSRITPQFERLGYSNYTVIRKADNRKTGTFGLYDRPGMEGVDIGFAFLPECEKKGYAFESASKLISIAFKEFGLTELIGMTVRENIEAQKLLEKLGFMLDGTTRLPDDEKEMLLYKISKQNSLNTNINSTGTKYLTEFK